MKQKSVISYSLIISAVLFLILGIVNITQVITRLSSSGGPATDPEQQVNLKEFEMVDKALHTTTRTPPFTFTGGFDTPFHIIEGSTRKGSRGAAKPVPIYNKLTLKGTLIKDKPLAVIEDEDGKTFISKQGDRIHNLTIVSISDDRVTLRSSSGTVTLKVKER